MSARDAERLARVELSRLYEPGHRPVTELLERMSAAELMERLRADHRVGATSGRAGAAQPASASEVAEADEVARRLAAVNGARDLERAAKKGLRFVIPGDEEWPRQLDRLGRCLRQERVNWLPWGLWVRGALRLGELAPAVALVGSRYCTTYGATWAASAGAALTEAGFTVVSGGAYGIDAAAHRGSLAGGGPTVAVLACGADRNYPLENTNLLTAIAERGAVVSEMPPGCAPMRHRFLTRNRLIAGLTAGTVVVEAAARSGALSTANWAAALDRPVMGVPGPVTSAASEGVHELIRSGAATLVANAAHVLEMVGEIGDHLVPDLRGPERPRDSLDALHQAVLDAVPLARPAPVETIARAAAHSVLAAEEALHTLSGAGFVERAEDGWRLTALARTS